MPIKEVMELFDLPQILRHNARFDIDKLNWLNGEYVRELPDERFYELSVHALGRAGIDTNGFPLPFVKAALDTCKGKIKLFSELAGYAGFYFKEEVDYDAEAARKDFVPENRPRLAALRDAFARLTSFDAASIEAALKETAAALRPGLRARETPARRKATRAR
jgi:glutamyl-tRNA synthetase